MLREWSQMFAVAGFVTLFVVLLTAGIVRFPVVGNILMLAIGAGFAANGAIWAAIWLRKALS